MKLWSGQFPTEPPSGFELFWQDTPTFFRIFMIIFAVVAVGILSAIFYALFKGIKQYVTYEFQNGARIELEVPDNMYGLVVEGDRGELTYQGTRFKGFNRAVDRAAGNAEG
ncbi:DUF2500 domain-containing protein [Paenibacillus rhizophilus]|uniref:DUF2500 family protein n=1 Tax=Paenibacillus rhizophilus TaxID=1850366 RepID=A0A3N9PC29_9BACL|nr:DUF2500 domain-containing protein [Paenibacillus rhizophilus]RQW13803.1 DUF2500 family protein [Paenibacillus rhizophilus]